MQGLLPSVSHLYGLTVKLYVLRWPRARAEEKDAEAGRAVCLTLLIDRTRILAGGGNPDKETIMVKRWFQF